MSHTFADPDPALSAGQPIVLLALFPTVLLFTLRSFTKYPLLVTAACRYCRILLNSTFALHTFAILWHC
jgi:hypothetical protein